MADLEARLSMARWVILVVFFVVPALVGWRRGWFR